jgi:competence protein ComEA
MGLRARLDALSRGELVGLVVVVLAVLGGAGLWYARSLPKPVGIEALPGAVPSGAIAPAGSSPAPVAGSGSAAATASASAAQLIVDVTGLVRQPGVYQFPSGARVVDAVERAGGALPKADLSLLNLAAPLVDGQQVVVLKEGATPVVAPGTTGGTSVSTGGPINVNTADAATLETLDGIGEVLAGDIVAYRDEHGPFTSVDQLEDVSGIGPSTLEAIRDQVTV